VASQGPLYAGTVVNDPIASNTDWTNPGNAGTDNGVLASNSSSGATDYLKATNFGFTIPSGATIVGIVVECEASTDASGNELQIRIVKGGAVGATERSQSAAWAGVISRGSSSDLWGETWTDTDINAADFGFAISETGNAGGSVYVDFMRVTVYYSEVPVIVASYSEANQSFANAVSSFDYDGSGQSFTGNGGILDTVRFYLKRTGAPTGNAVAKVYAHSGTFGTSSIPTGSALATSQPFDSSTLSTSYSLIEFAFTGADRVTLTDGTKYVVTLEFSGGGSGNRIDVATDTTSPSHGGNNVISSTLPTWIADSATDQVFYVYSEPPPPPPPLPSLAIIPRFRRFPKPKLRTRLPQ
jgi:hypothetical protein